MQALKQAEELVGIFHVEAHAVVANEKHAIRLPANFDHTSRLVAAVFEGVGQQVGEYLAHQIGVAVCGSQRVDSPLYLPILVFGL